MQLSALLNDCTDLDTLNTWIRHLQPRIERGGRYLVINEKINGKEITGSVNLNNIVKVSVRIIEGSSPTEKNRKNAHEILELIEQKNQQAWQAYREKIRNTCCCCRKLVRLIGAIKRLLGNCCYNRNKALKKLELNLNNSSAIPDSPSAKLFGFANDFFAWTRRFDAEEGEKEKKVEKEDRDPKKTEKNWGKEDWEKEKSCGGSASDYYKQLQLFGLLCHKKPNRSDSDLEKAIKEKMNSWSEIAAAYANSADDVRNTDQMITLITKEVFDHYKTLTEQELLCKLKSVREEDLLECHKRKGESLQGRLAPIFARISEKGAELRAGTVPSALLPTHA